MKMYIWRGVDEDINIFLTLALVGGGWLVSLPGHFTPREKAPVPIEQQAGWSPKPAWEKIFYPNRT
jgi:hypothetical protein